MCLTIKLVSINRSTTFQSLPSEFECGQPLNPLSWKFPQMADPRASSGTGRHQCIDSVMNSGVKTHWGGMALHYEGHKYFKIREGRDGQLFWRCSLHKTALSLLKDAAMTEGLTLDPSTVICNYELAIIQALSLNNFPNCRSTRWWWIVEVVLDCRLEVCSDSKSAWFLTSLFHPKLDVFVCWLKVGR